MLIVLEGLNGTGKTSLARYLSSVLEIPIFKPFRTDHDIHWGTGSALEAKLKGFGVPVNSHLEDVFMADFLRTFPQASAILDRGMPSAVSYGVENGSIPDLAAARSLLVWWLDQLAERSDVYYIYMVCSAEESRARAGDRALGGEARRRVDDVFSYTWAFAFDAFYNAIKIDTTSLTEDEKNKKVMDFLDEQKARAMDPDKVRRDNARMNECRREAIALGIRSPSRQAMYIAGRLKGRTKAQAHEQAKNKNHGPR